MHFITYTSFKILKFSWILFEVLCLLGKRYFQDFVCLSACELLGIQVFALIRLSCGLRLLTVTWYTSTHSGSELLGCSVTWLVFPLCSGSELLGNLGLLDFLVGHMQLLLKTQPELGKLQHVLPQRLQTELLKIQTGTSAAFISAFTRFILVAENLFLEPESCLLTARYTRYESIYVSV